ncbi:ABC transporter ATP-binding protein [Cohnella silvisoli]|uniref:ATP-binding cassette domain-containing protein n=1 Tax=Cohnella silvisoli TaxID=2873699 RepID=A0ABV1KST0_9BACL|nr:ATP-binding cassette domain-containing protein [Cohnella silvisoli]MCD9022657.1 ATP-binding cassette domain-containing protein [Cohnella silvisoli]
MAHYELQKVTFTYPEETLPALSELSLSVPSGEFVVLCGPSGSGKSTLLRLLKREVSPGGRMSGVIMLDQLPIQDWPARELAGLVGLVMQNPDNQLVVDTVEHELAFGLENFGLGREAMRRRMAEMAGFFGLEPLLDRKTDELSGGQKQTVNLAAVLMLQPRVLLLDEPLAQLDPLAARELLGMIKRLNEEWGITVIMSEHRIDDLLPLADRVVRMELGRIAFNGNARDYVLEAWDHEGEDWVSSLPSVTRWALEQLPPSSQLHSDEPPLTVKETRNWLSRADMEPKLASETLDHKTRNATVSQQYRHSTTPSPASDPTPASTKPLLAADGLFYAYDKHSPAVLKGLEWQIRHGDWAVLFGGNGSGKSTLLQLLAGLRLPQRGAVHWEGTPFARMSSKERFSAIGYLAQNPLLHYAYDSLSEDLLQAANRAEAEDPKQEVEQMAERFGLTHLLSRHPHDMSGGEQQLGALAITLLGKPRLLLLDEPTKGLDPLAKLKLGEHLENIHAQGTTLIIATHDIELAAAYANRCSLLFHGEIVADGEPEQFFQGNLFYATALHRLFALGEASS